MNRRGVDMQPVAPPERPPSKPPDMRGLSKAAKQALMRSACDNNDPSRVRIARSGGLADVSARFLELLSRACVESSVVPRGEVVVSGGRDDDNIYVLLGGTFELTESPDRLPTPLRAPACVGAALLGVERRRLHWRLNAVTTAEVATCPAQAFRILLRRFPADEAVFFGAGDDASMTARGSSATSVSEAHSTSSIEERQAASEPHTLHDASGEDGGCAPKTIHFPLPVHRPHAEPPPFRRPTGSLTGLLTVATPEAPSAGSSARGSKETFGVGAAAASQGVMAAGPRSRALAPTLAAVCSARERRSGACQQSLQAQRSDSRIQDILHETCLTITEQHQQAQGIQLQRQEDHPTDWTPDTVQEDHFGDDEAQPRSSPRRSSDSRFVGRTCTGHSVSPESDCNKSTVGGGGGSDSEDISCDSPGNNGLLVPGPSFAIPPLTLTEAHEVSKSSSSIQDMPLKLKPPSKSPIFSPRPTPGVRIRTPVDSAPGSDKEPFPSTFSLSSESCPSEDSPRLSAVRFTSFEPKLRRSSEEYSAEGPSTGGREKSMSSEDTSSPSGRHANGVPRMLRVPQVKSNERSDSPRPLERPPGTQRGSSTSSKSNAIAAKPGSLEASANGARAFLETRMKDGGLEDETLKNLQSSICSGLSGNRQQQLQEEGWQRSLCQEVLICCPTALPTKDVMAKLRVARPVSREESPGSRDAGTPLTPASLSSPRQPASAMKPPARPQGKRSYSGNHRKVRPARSGSSSKQVPAVSSAAAISMLATAKANQSAAPTEDNVAPLAKALRSVSEGIDHTALQNARLELLQRHGKLEQAGSEPKQEQEGSSDNNRRKVLGLLRQELMRGLAEATRVGSAATDTCSRHVISDIVIGS
eukprot:TRINITY_DN40472_c0_g1_i1.p1 TRINITY_DN40472_c0_g1~~TRINITY_DN40472_c0_g1_i1.p1  ORF type:complete len:871 (+),score=148.58 TRINITY_DN40472_c0_g1_i1:249-2861(+)